MTRALLAAFTLAYLFGCGAREAEESPPKSPVNETRDEVQSPLPDAIVSLTTEELRDTLVGATIIDDHMSWTHCEGGVVHVGGTRAPYTGSYTIRDGQVCMHGACSRIYRQGEDIYYTEFLGPAPGLRPVVLARPPGGGGAC